MAMKGSPFSLDTRTPSSTLRQDTPNSSGSTPVSDIAANDSDSAERPQLHSRSHAREGSGLQHFSDGSGHGCSKGDVIAGMRRELEHLERKYRDNLATARTRARAELKRARDTHDVELDAVREILAETRDAHLMELSDAREALTAANICTAALRADLAEARAAEATARAELDKEKRFQAATLTRVARLMHDVHVLRAQNDALKADLQDLQEQLSTVHVRGYEQSPSTPPREPRPPTPPPPPSNGNAATAYEHYWNLILNSDDTVPWRFRIDTFPWPVHTPGDITRDGILHFFGLPRQLVCSDAINTNARHVIRKQLGRWHPDKFDQRNTLGLVVESDRAAVSARQKEIALCLTMILEKIKL